MHSEGLESPLAIHRACWGRGRPWPHAHWVHHLGHHLGVGPWERRRRNISSDGPQGWGPGFV